MRDGFWKCSHGTVMKFGMNPTEECEDCALEDPSIHNGCLRILTPTGPCANCGQPIGNHSDFDGYCPPAP